MPISSYLNEANQILNVMNKAKEYLDGVSFTVSISNYSTEYVCIDSFILDDSLFDMKRKEQASIMPNLFIAKGQTEQAHFKSNVFFDSSSSFLFNVRHKGKDHSVLVNYQWSKGKGKIDIILKTDASEKKISGNLFKRIYGQNEDLKVVAFSNGGHLQLGFGDFSS